MGDEPVQVRVLSPAYTRNPSVWWGSVPGIQIGSGIPDSGDRMGEPEVSQPEERDRRFRRRFLSRGESLIAGAGLLMGGLLLLVMAALAVGAHSIERDLVRASRESLAASLERSVALAGDSVLASRGLTGLRRFVQEVAQQDGIGEVRIELGDGRVLASSDARRINVSVLPEHLPSVAADSAVGDVIAPLGGGHVIVRCVPAEVAGGAGGWWIQTIVGGAGAASLISLWLVYRTLRRRVGAMGAISEALIAAGEGEESTDALMVDERMGPAARAWNALLRDREALRERLVRERAGEALSGVRGGRGLADDACDALWQGIIVLDDHGSIAYANGTARVFLDRDEDEILGEDLLRLVDHDGLREAVRGVVSGQIRRRVSVEVERDGAREDVLRFSVRPLRGADTGVAVVVIEDVTQQKVASRATNGFVAQATHELRTPLTNIRLYAEEAIDLNEGDAGERARCLNVINQEVRRLERLVGDMLNVSEMESGSMSLRVGDVRLQALFEDLRAEYDAQATDKGVALEWRLPPKYPVFGADRDKLAMAIHNLVGNAIKYTPGGGRVTVTLEADDHEMRLEVRDTGPGIEEEDQDRIFQPFYRTDSARSSGVKGTGLGLAIAREIARLHGGDITLESVVGSGSVFTLRVPNAGVMDGAMAA